MVTLGLMVAARAGAEAPPISDPGGMAPVGAMPGTYPTTVTGAIMRVDQFLPAVLGGADSDNLKVSFPAAGPIKWTESRHNEGDISPLIGPFDPNDASYYPPNSFTNNYQPLQSGQPFSNTTLAWRLSNQTGAAFATVRHNGFNHGTGFTANGSPVGTIHGIAYFNQAGQGWGYRMSDGVFNNGGNGSLDLTMGVAGADGNLGEASFNTAMTYFPYEQGWQGAWVNGGDEGAGFFGAGAPGMSEETVFWTVGRAQVTLPEVNSATDGMLFVAPTGDSGNQTRIAAAFPTGGGWNVAVRDDAQVTPNVTLDSTGNGFQFLYVPYSANGLIGGNVNGTTGATIQGAGDARFDITRTAAGKYALSVYAPNGVTKLTESQGTIVMSVSGALGSDPTIADRAFLSYQYDSGSGNFLIESRELAAQGSPSSENQFGDDLALRDANFYLPGSTSPIRCRRAPRRFPATSTRMASWTRRT
jgi:hypothetical protein